MILFSFYIFYSIFPFLITFLWISYRVWDFRLRLLTNLFICNDNNQLYDRHWSNHLTFNPHNKIFDIYFFITILIIVIWATWFANFIVLLCYDFLSFDFLFLIHLWLCEACLFSEKVIYLVSILGTAETVFVVLVHEWDLVRIRILRPQSLLKNHVELIHRHKILGQISSTVWILFLWNRVLHLVECLWFFSLAKKKKKKIVKVWPWFYYFGLSLRNSFWFSDSDTEQTGSWGFLTWI